MALRVLGVAPLVGEKGVALKVGEKGVALKVGEKAASHLTPLHAPVQYYYTLKLVSTRFAPTKMQKSIKNLCSKVKATICHNKTFTTLSPH